MSSEKTEQLEKPKRLHEIAKELNIGSTELIDYLKEKKYQGKNLSLNTKIDEEMYNDIMIKFHPEKVSAEKKFEHKKKKLQFTDEEKVIEKKILEIPVGYKEPKSKDKKISVEVVRKVEEEIVEEVKFEKPVPVLEEKVKEVVEKVVEKKEIEKVKVEEKPKKIEEEKVEEKIEVSEPEIAIKEEIKETVFDLV